MRGAKLWCELRAKKYGLKEADVSTWLRRHYNGDFFTAEVALVGGGDLLLAVLNDKPIEEEAKEQ